MVAGEEEPLMRPNASAVRGVASHGSGGEDSGSHRWPSAAAAMEAYSRV